MLNRRNSERDWLQGVVNQIVGKQQAKRVAANNHNIYKYADFVCPSCTKPYTRTAAIDQCSGICAQCGEGLIAVSEVLEQQKIAEEGLYECVGCGENHRKASLTTGYSCACGGGNFVSQKDMNQVVMQTRAFMQQRGIQLEDIYHEKGSIYASLVARSRDGSSLKALVRASGSFTPNDMLAFDWNPGKGASARVITAQVGDTVIPFLPNHNVNVEWKYDDDHVNPETVQMTTTANAQGEQDGIAIGTKLCWYAGRGKSYKGEVIGATQDGALVVGITYDEMGPTKPGEYAGQVSLTQEDIQKLGVMVD